MKRILILAALALGCSGPAHHKFGAIQRADVVTSVNGQAGDVTVASVVFANGVSTGAVQLASLGSSSYAEGQLAYVATLKATFDLEASTATTVPLVNFPATGKSGYEWVRKVGRNPTWEVRTSWIVDPQNGGASDENDGAGSGTPLQTLTELSRRLAGAVLANGATVAVSLASDCLNTDKPVWTFSVTPGAAAGTGLVITGTPTVIYTGSLTSPFVQQAQGSVATATDNEIADSAVATSFTAAGLVGSGLIYKRTNSTACYWYPLKDLGSKTLRISEPTNVTANGVTLIASGDTYTVSRLTKIYDQFFAVLPGRIAYVTFALLDDNTTQSANPIITAKADLQAVIYDRCTFSTARLLSNGRLLNCAMWANVGMTGASGVVRMDGGARISSSALTVTNACVIETTLVPQFQGCGINISSQGNGFGAIAIFDSLTGLTIVTGSAEFNNIKGSGNTGPVVNARDYGAMIGYNSVTAPPATAGSIVSGSLYQCGNGAVAGTSSNAVPVTAEIPNRMLAIVPF